MSQLLLQVLIVVAFGAFCFGLPHRLHRHTQPLARRNDQARCRPLPLADGRLGMGAVKRAIDEAKDCREHRQAAGISWPTRLVSIKVRSRDLRERTMLETPILVLLVVLAIAAVVWWLYR
jgi:hypothetical protein